MGLVEMYCCICDKDNFDIDTGINLLEVNLGDLAYTVIGTYMNPK